MTLSDNTTALQTALEMINNLPDAGGGIPDYVREEADRAATALLSVQGSRTFTFAAVSDIHVNVGDAYATQTQETITHAGMAIERVASQVGIDLMVNLGDNLWGTNTDVALAKEEHLITNRALFDAFRSHPKMHLVGNHDANLYNAIVPTTAIYSLMGKCNDYDVRGVMPFRGYGYKDFEQYKLRVIGLNTSDYIDEKGGYCLSDEQKLWLMAALDLSEKEDAADWQTLILSHIPLDFPSSDDNAHTDVPAILSAYRNGSTVSITAGSYDYSGKNAAQIVGNVHGHMHNFSYGNMAGNGYLRVCTPNTCFYNNGASATSYEDMYLPNETYDKIAASATDTTVTFYTVNLDTKKIYSTNYGAGYDREFSYAPADQWSETVDDLAVAIRQGFYVTNGALDISSANTDMILACSTDNGHGWATRESTTVYLIPVPEEATNVTVATADASVKTMYVTGVNVSGSTYSYAFRSGHVDVGTYEFEQGSAAYMAIVLRYEETSVPWGYNLATYGTTVTFSN